MIKNIDPFITKKQITKILIKKIINPKEKKQLKNYFKEFYSNQNKCKFKNCMHLKEPGCEIKKMLVNGKISESRYNNYKKMLKDELNLR